MDLFLVTLLTFFLILIDVCVPLNYLTCEKNGALDMQHNNNNTLVSSLTFAWRVIRESFVTYICVTCGTAS